MEQSETDANIKYFQKLFGEVEEEVDQLKRKVRQLQKEKKQLQKKLQDCHNKNNDIFSSLEETDRIAYKHQIKGLISKIDEHLNRPQ